MKFVIDTNQLRTDQLRQFLARSSQNIAVIPDFVAMEAYKGDPLKHIFKSMSVLSDFPRQVIVLKGSAKVCALSGRRKGLQRRLVDENQTQGFSEFIRTLRLAEAGNTRLQAQIQNLGTSANEHLEKMRVEADNIRGAIEVLGKSFTKDEKELLKRTAEFTSELIDKLVREVMELAAMCFKDSPLVRKRPAYAELPNTFIFRVILALYHLNLRKHSQGALVSLSADKLRNDFVDMMIVAYGTYFDGLMSADVNVNYMYGETSVMLAGLFDAEVPSLAHLKR